jgi:hypothetical protein
MYWVWLADLEFKKSDRVIWANRIAWLGKDALQDCRQYYKEKINTDAVVLEAENKK